jgi:hypothetical protein
MGYTVFSPMDEDGAQASGLSLSEAFARMMALAHCDYSFARSNGDVCLMLTPADAPENFPVEPPPGCRSKLLDNEMARAEIMRRFLKNGYSSYRIVTDEDWQLEERRRSEQNGYRPARHVDWE